MPAAITHYFHGKRVVEEIKKKRELSFLNEDAFLWGSQGPDFLFCSRVMPWQKGESLLKYGSKLHEMKPSCLFSAIKQYESLHSNEIIRSYILGFLCHYSADRICHPFVRYGVDAFLEQDPSQNETVLHNQIESALDCIILRYESAQLPMEFPLKRAVPKNETVMKAIADLYVYLFSVLFHKTMSSDTMLLALKDCRSAFGWLTDRTGLKKNLVEKFEGKKKHRLSCHIRPVSEGDIDYANVMRNEWNWPLDSAESRDDTFFDLYEKAIGDGVQLVFGWDEATDMELLTKNLSFKG